MSEIETVQGIRLHARYAGLAEMREVLEDQRARAIDLVASQSWINAKDGQLQVTGAPVQMAEGGVTDPNGTFTVTGVAEEGLAEKLGIHRSYLRWMHENRPDLWDMNVNGILHGGEEGGFSPYAKSLMLRMLRGDQSGSGIVRAVVSDRYARIDNLDVLVATLGGVRDAGMLGKVEVHGDITDRRMYVTIEAPEIKALAPVLLAGYRNPFGGGGVERIRALADREGMGYAPGTEPIIHAGLKLTNSETGFGRFKIAPHLIVKICRNGMTIGRDAMAAIHLGGQQEEGVIEWSDRTNRKALELVASKAQDAVTRFLSPEYIAAQVAELEQLAGAPVSKPAETIKVISQTAGVPKDLADDILGAFIAGGQLTAAGVMNAYTAAAQMITDADLAALIEEAAPAILAQAARIG